MVRKIQTIAAFFRLIRWSNLLMVVVTMVLMRYSIILPMLQNIGLSVQLTNAEFFLLILSTVFITAGGYVINDYFDRRTDLINRAGDIIVSKQISRRWAMTIHFIFTAVGLITGFYLSIKTGLKPLSLIFIAVSGLLWFYSSTYKHQFILGNVIIAILTALVPLMVLIFELPLLSREYGNVADAMGLDTGEMIHWVLYFSFFAFLFTVIREIVKDMEDNEGDQAYGMRTLPIVMGNISTKIVIFSLSFILIVILVIYYFIFAKNLIAFSYLVFFVISPLIFVCYRLIKANSRNQYHHISVILKIIMVFGILYAIIVRFTIIN